MKEKINKLIINEPEANADFLWKYLDIHRFIYFLTEQKLFFTRLDKLNDPYEGVATWILRQANKYANIPLKKEDFADEIPKRKRAQLINEKKIYDFQHRLETDKSQKRQYVNCWYSDDRESMAMWNLYSNTDSVALKVTFKEIKVGLFDSFDSFISENGDRVNIIGQKVKYLKLNPFDAGLPKQNIVYSGLKKDKSFEYEKEYRFLISTIDGLDKIQPFYTIPIDIEKLNLTVVTHPNIEEWKFKNLQKLISLSNHKIKIEKSAILLKKEG